VGLKSLLILIGGALGTGIRAALEAAYPAQPGGWPWATFLINVTGAFPLGVLLETLIRRGPDSGVRQYLRLGLGTGVLGGYTTYSTFAVEAVRLLGAGAVLIGIGYAIASVILGLAAALAGTLLAARLEGEGR
jgi:CrcB protein